MKLNIQREFKGERTLSSYNVEKVENQTLLSILLYIKEKVDNTLTFRHGCRSGACGSCAIRVNGVERLACKTKVEEGDLIEPIKNAKIIRDLVVDLSHELKKLKESKTFLDKFSNIEVTTKDEKAIDVQSNCILCQSCYSSCPVFEVNENFLGPYALTRVYRYVNDKKESEIKDKIDTIQQNGVWDCTLCGNCTIVCPQHIDPKTDIINLRNKSAQFGYTDPNMANFGGGLDFGFNPNGF